MPLEFNDSLPIYQQLCDYFEAMLVSGQLVCGEKVRAVRDYAMELGVNPNTLQKAFAMLESKGLLRSERTSGRYVTDDGARLKKLKQERTHKVIAEYFEKMKQLGFEEKEAVEMILQSLTERLEGREV